MTTRYSLSLIAAALFGCANVNAQQCCDGMCSTGTRPLPGSRDAVAPGRWSGFSNDPTGPWERQDWTGQPTGRRMDSRYGVPAYGDFRNGDFRNGDFRNGEYRNGDFRNGDFTSGDFRDSGFRNDSRYREIPNTNRFRDGFPYANDEFGPNDRRPEMRRGEDGRFSSGRNQPQYTPARTWNAPQLPYRSGEYRPQLNDRQIHWESDLSRAASIAAEQNRPLLVQVSADWCPHCQTMKRDTYTDPSLIRVLNSSFISVAVDADREKQFVQGMKISSLPTTLIVSPDRRVLERVNGARTADQLLQMLTPYGRRAESESPMAVACR